ncbi:MAG TPA: hypothetical protein VJ617_02470 [Arthrobacter sp.]|nr:hypothetical protein [Arthrobacter sp.]
MTIYGADVSQLRDLAKAVDKAASLLSSRATSLQGQIQAAPWKGADGDHFRQDWTSSHRPGLERVVSSLRENSKILLKHADEQEQASGGGSGGSAWEKLQSLANPARNWLLDQAQKAAEASAHRKELEQGLDTALDARPEEQAKWWDSLSDEDRQYLIEGTGGKGPLAYDLMKMDGGIPESAQELAKDHLREVARENTAVYRETGKASLDARIGWGHGGADVGTEAVENADGSATLKVYGKLGMGVNHPTGAAGVTLNGEVSREYRFRSLEEAVAAREQLYRDLPPDSLEDFTGTIGEPTGVYVLKTIDAAATANGSEGFTDKAKGTFSVEAEGKTGPASGSAKLALAYERNLWDGTATASGEVSAQGKFNLGGPLFEASGKGGLEVKLDKDNSIKSIALSMDGTVAQGATGGAGDHRFGAESAVTVGSQASVKIDVAYTPDTAEAIDSYMRNVAAGDTVAAANDAAKLYDAGAATVQVNSVATASNSVRIDAGVGEVTLKTENKATTNLTTLYKVPYDSKLEML